MVKLEGRCNPDVSFIDSMLVLLVAVVFAIGTSADHDLSAHPAIESDHELNGFSLFSFSNS